MKSNQKLNRRWRRNLATWRLNVLKQQENTTSSDVHLQENTKLELTGQKLTKHHPLGSRKGELSELIATTWFWDRGWEVFRNSSSTGPIDLIVLKDGELILIDVKTRPENKRSGYGRTERQKELGVCVFQVDVETNTCSFVEHIE